MPHPITTNEQRDPEAADEATRPDLPVGRGVRLWSRGQALLLVCLPPPALGDCFKNRAKCLFSRGWKCVGNRFLTK